jgi:hypothetical protein
MDKDEFFKDFTLDDYRFIVVNSNDIPVPLVWKFEETQKEGNLIIGDNIMRDPFEIGKELSYYIQEKPVVPQGISITSTNSISKWLERK